MFVLAPGERPFSLDDIAVWGRHLDGPLIRHYHGLHFLLGVLLDDASSTLGDHHGLSGVKPRLRFLITNVGSLSSSLMSALLGSTHPFQQTDCFISDRLLPKDAFLFERGAGFGVRLLSAASASINCCSISPGWPDAIAMRAMVRSSTVILSGHFQRRQRLGDVADVTARYGSVDHGAMVSRCESSRASPQTQIAAPCGAAMRGDVVSPIGGSRAPALGPAVPRQSFFGIYTKAARIEVRVFRRQIYPQRLAAFQSSPVNAEITVRPCARASAKAYL
jgi:hypothetical protein